MGRRRGRNIASSALVTLFSWGRDGQGRVGRKEGCRLIAANYTFLFLPRRHNVKEEERQQGREERKRKRDIGRRSEREREREGVGETRGEASNSLVFISVVSRFLRPPPIPSFILRPPLFLSIPPKKNSH